MYLLHWKASLCLQSISRCSWKDRWAICLLQQLLIATTLSTLKNCEKSHRSVYIYSFHFFVIYTAYVVPSVLWRCWLGGRKGIRPVKNWAVGCWRGICLEWGADLHMSQLMSLPLTVSCFSKIQIGFAFLVPAHLGSPGKRAVKRVCVCVCVCCYVCVCVF